MAAGPVDARPGRHRAGARAAAQRPQGRPGELATLTEQEQRILDLIGEGLTNRQIAEQHVPRREDGEELRLRACSPSSASSAAPRRRSSRTSTSRAELRPPDRRRRAPGLASVVRGRGEGSIGMVPEAHRHVARPKEVSSNLQGTAFDELLREVLGRVNDVLEERERWQLLLDAVVTMAADLSLDELLRRIIEAAADLAGARYAALGVLGVGKERRLDRFITHGLAPAQTEAIGELPQGPRDARPDHRPARAAAAARHHRAPRVLRLPGRPPADDVVPRRAGPAPRAGLRQPLPHREGRRRGLHRPGRGDRGRAGGRRGCGHRERPPPRGGRAPRAVAGGHGGGHPAAHGRARGRHRVCRPWSSTRMAVADADIAGIMAFDADGAVAVRVLAGVRRTRGGAAPGRRRPSHPRPRVMRSGEPTRRRGPGR